MNVAVFADVHGRLLLCLKLCQRWQRETGERLDLILQAGDLGAFPDPAQLDRATLNHARHDPTELGFSSYFIHSRPEVTAVLAELECNLVFVRGNHEDHAWLDNLEKQASAEEPFFPVDVYKRLYCLKSGALYHFQNNRDEKLSILGIGRIGQPNRQQFSQEPIYIQPYETNRIFAHKRSVQVDILLTHDRAAPDLRQGKSGDTLHKGGMAEIREAINSYEPLYHFYGHIGGAVTQDLEANEVTRSCKLADLTWTWDSRQVIEVGSMGILRWQNRHQHSFEVVAADWLSEYTAFSWQYL